MKLIISIVLFIILFAFINLINRETFDTEKCGPHTIVDPNNYVEDVGPSCISKCIIENVPKVHWDLSDNEREALIGGVNADILQFNRDNPKNSTDYCYAYNDNDGTLENLTNPCLGECPNLCNSNDKCEIYELPNGSKVCSERNLNMMSSGANLKISKCNECINKYWNNISTLWNKYQDYILPSNCS